MRIVLQKSSRAGTMATSHKYIRRTGTPGHYVYEYPDDEHRPRRRGKADDDKKKVRSFLREVESTHKRIVRDRSAEYEGEAKEGSKEVQGAGKTATQPADGIRDSRRHEEFRDDEGTSRESGPRFDVKSKAIKHFQEKAGSISVSVYEVDDPVLYHGAISDAKKNNDHGAFVTAYPAEDYKGKRMFLLDDGAAGVAVTSDGDIISVFKNPNRTDIPGVSQALMMVALRNGGNKLDCFDGLLPILYSRFGFRAVSRVKFDRDYAPEHWNYERDGEPDVVMMAHNGDSPDVVLEKLKTKSWIAYKPGDGEYASDYEAAISLRDSQLEKAVAKSRHALVLAVNQLIKAAKGEMVPGHKYIRRTGTPGNYKYIYEEPKKNVPYKKPLAVPALKGSKNQKHFEAIEAARDELIKQEKQIAKLFGLGYDDLLEQPTDTFDDANIKARELKREISKKLAKRLGNDPDWIKLADYKTKVMGGVYQYASLNYYERVASSLLKVWAITSGDTDDQAVALQLAAQEEFGLEANTWYPDDIKKSAEIIWEPVKTGMRKFLRAMYEETQEWYKQNGITHVYAYRGVAYTEDALNEQERNDWHQPNKARYHEICLQPMSSFSISLEMAYRFTYVPGSVPTDYKAIIMASIPVERIISTCMSGFGCLRETEIVALGSPSDFAAVLTWDRRIKAERPLYKDVRSSFAELAMKRAIRIEKSAANTAKSSPLLIDKDIHNADWTKGSWDLPPYKSKEFLAMLRHSDKTLDHFKTLPVYNIAVARGLIKEDKWVDEVKKSHLVTTVTRLRKMFIKAQRGEMVPGHKYIERKGTPGDYTYVYPEDQAETHLKRTEPLTGDERRPLVPLWRFPKPVMEYLENELGSEIEQLDKWRPLWDKALKNPQTAVQTLLSSLKKQSKYADKYFIELTSRVNELLNRRPELKRLARDYYQQASEYHKQRVKAEALKVRQKREKAQTEAAVKAKDVLDAGAMKDLLQETDINHAMRAMAVLVHQGLLRVGSRGAVKGKAVINQELLRSMEKSQDVRVNLVAIMGRSLQEKLFGGYSLGARGYLSFRSVRDHTAPLEFNTSEPFGLSRVAKTLGLVNQRTTYYDDVRKIASAFNGNLYHIAKSIEEFNAGRESYLEELFNPTAKTKDIAKDREAAKKLEQERASTKADTEAALKAQSDDSWEPISGLETKHFNTGEPRKYVCKGLNWILAAKNGILGYDTGLGKTLISLMAGKKLIQKGIIKKAIYVVPVTCVTQWGEETKEKWFPKAKVAMIYGTPEQKSYAWKKAKNAEVVIIGHSALQNDEEVQKLQALDGAVFIDEGHICKNPQTITYKNAQDVLNGRDYSVLLTATPMPNKPEDLFHLVELVKPGVLGNKERFRAKFVKTVYDERLKQMVPAGYHNLAELHKIIKPWVFIKKKKDPDVDIEMPEFDPLEMKLDLSPEQEKWYRAVQLECLDDLEGVEDTEKLTRSECNNILKVITRLRQICISPYLISDKYDGPEPKIEAAMEEIQAHNLTDPGHPVVVFSGFNQALYRLRDRLIQEYGYDKSDIVEISGAVTKKKRDEARKAINSGQCKVAIINEKAGGVGLNLQDAATKIIRLNNPWRPIDVEQADARVYRQGQKNKVTKITYRHPNTIDDFLVTKLYTKKSASIAMLEGKDDADGPILSWKDYAELIGLSPEQIRDMKTRIAERKKEREAEIGTLDIVDLKQPPRKRTVIALKADKREKVAV